MAKDELIFDSDRQAKQGQRKRILVPALIALGVLAAIAVVVLLLLGKGKDQHTGGEDTPYPYTWQQQDDGSTRLAISLGDAAGCRWALSGETEGQSALTVTQGQSKDSENVFLLTPAQPGRALFTLILRGEKDENDTRYRVDFLTETSQDGKSLKLELLSSKGTALQGHVSGGADSRNPYEYYLEDNGDLALILTINDVMDWSLNFEPQEQKIVNFLGMGLEDGDEDRAKALFRAGTESGTCQLMVRSASTGAFLTLEISNENGALLVTSDSAVYATEPPEASEAPETTGQTPAETAKP